MDELEIEDASRYWYFNFPRMSYQIYQGILKRAEHRIKPKKPKYIKSLTAGIELTMTLRYLALGNSYHSLIYGFLVAHNTISKIIRQICDTILVEFSD